MDGGAWKAAVHGVAEGQTGLGVEHHTKNSRCCSLHLEKVCAAKIKLILKICINCDIIHFSIGTATRGFVFFKCLPWVRHCDRAFNY